MKLGTVNKDETVVEVVGVRDRQPLVLAVELRDFGRRRLATILADEANGHARPPSGQHVKGRCIRIWINNDKISLSTLDDPLHLAQGVEFRPRRKNAAWEKMSIGQCREDGVETLLVPVLIKNLLATKLIKLLKDLPVGDQIPPHGDKGIDNAYRYLDCPLGL